jgi:hypothetical protein
MGVPSSVINEKIGLLWECEKSGARFLMTLLLKNQPGLII